MRWKKYFVACLFLVCAGASVCCGRKDGAEPQVLEFSNSMEICSQPQKIFERAYEPWQTVSQNIHMYDRGVDVEVGNRIFAKYLEREAVSPWLKPEYISTDTAQKEGLLWARDRYVRWLGGVFATVHFPFYGENWPGNLFFEISLRPKVNASMAVRFYRPDGSGGRIWSQPLTTDLEPGYWRYRWCVPREWLSEDGMQLVRISFPGTYFEGNDRVSAKIYRMRFGVMDGVCEKKIGEVEPLGREIFPENVSILSDALPAFKFRESSRMERYIVMPHDSVSLDFYSAPGAWLEVPGKLYVDIQDDEKREKLAEIALKPGDCWQRQHVDLSRYSGRGVRLSVYFKRDHEITAGDEPGLDGADAYVGIPQLSISDQKLQDAWEQFLLPKRMVILAVDNLRADRIMNKARRRATIQMSGMAAHGVSGVLMGEGKSFVALATSFLTGVNAKQHGVMRPGIFVRQSLPSMAQQFQEAGWKTHFFTASSIIDAAHGFAKGFNDQKKLGISTVTALDEVYGQLKDSPERTLFYVHLSQLRLPFFSSRTKLEQWGDPGYIGNVNPQTMRNTTVVKTPTRADAKQFEAYYDGVLSEIDDAIGQFVQKVPSDTLVVIYGTHGCSLGETSLGYEQGLEPWELLTPYILYMPGKRIGVINRNIMGASDISSRLVALVSDDEKKRSTIFSSNSFSIQADDGDMSATSTWRYFYRILREGVDSVYSTGLEDGDSQRLEGSFPILRQALREMIQ